MQILLKKTLHISKVKSMNGDDYVADDEGITNKLYGLFEVGKVSINETPLGGKYFDSLDELNAHFDTKYEDKNIPEFSDIVKRKQKDYKKRLTDIGYFDCSCNGTQ